jgi:hypothetical protein
MNYFEKLIYWWDRRIVRAALVSIILIAMLTVEYGFFLALIWLLINLAWSSRLNPAWTHTFGPMEWYRYPNASFAAVSNYSIKVYRMDVNEVPSWVCEVWLCGSVDVDDPIYTDYDNTRAEACVKAYRWLADTYGV